MTVIEAKISELKRNTKYTASRWVLVSFLVKQGQRKLSFSLISGLKTILNTSLFA